MLNLSKVPYAEWSRENALWLNTALQRGDDIWLVTDPVKHSQLMQQLGKQSYYLYAGKFNIKRENSSNNLTTTTTAAADPTKE